jgi:hypothetical protein
MSAQASTKSSSAPPVQTRKPWKKKTPIEVVLEQGDKLRQQIAERETELKEWKRHLQKLDEARKIFEA